MDSFLLLAAHVCGDFVLQNHWMQRKSSSSCVCSVHVCVYALPFATLLSRGLPEWALVAILVQHWLQDRFSLHTRWMRWFGHTLPKAWPVGPLCVDQAFHITFLGIIATIITH